MNEIIEKEDIKIEDMIYEIRGIQVMLDSDLAKLYNVETKRINEAVKNNPRKFPERFSWLITEKEWEFLRSKFSTLENSFKGRGHYRKYLPRVFTEHGIYMLSTILKSNIATEVSIRIMDTFVDMRKFINDNKDIYKSISNINEKLLEHDEKFNYLFSKFDRKEKLFLQGEIYDAYSSFISIFKEANEEIIVVDAYADITFLDLIRNINCNIILITKNSERLSDIEIAKYNKQYNNLKVIRDNSFHDRYFILDRKIVYHSGASLNNAGSKTFSLNKLEDEFVISTILNNILKIIKNDLSSYETV